MARKPEVRDMPKTRTETVDLKNKCQFQIKKFRHIGNENLSNLEYP
jgi:hypothetical protein